MSKQASKAIALPESDAVETGPVAVPLLTVEQAKAGTVPDVDSAIGQVRDRLAVADQVNRLSVWDATLLFHALVTVGGSVKQGEYVERIGKSKAYGTTLARLSDAAIRLGVEPGSEVWAYLVQKGGTAPVGVALKNRNKRTALSALKGQAAEMREHGKITSGARVPRPNGGTDDKSTDETDAPTVALTLSNALDLVDHLAKSATREEWASAENRIGAIITRENTVRAAAAKREASAKSA